MSLPFYIYFMALSFLASIFFILRPNEKYSYLKYFVPFLFATIAVEAVGIYLASLNKLNIWLYNFFTTIEFCFYFWVISRIVQRAIAKKILRWLIVVYAIVAFVNIVFFQKINVFHTVTYSLGCLLTVSACVYYFLEIFRMPMYVKLKNNPSFWICSGLLFYYSCTFPLFGLMNYWIGVSKLLLENFSNIVMILNIFLYSLFTIAFLCGRTRKYTS